MRTNSFTNNMNKKSNNELENILAEKSNYTDEAVQAVIWEMENRGLLEKSLIDSDEVHEKDIPVEVLKEDESSFKKFELPILYSKSAILGFTMFFSTIFGAVLLMSNLKAMKKPKARIEVLVFGIVYTIFTYFILNYIPRNFLFTLIFNVIGYVVLSEYFWNKYLGKDLKLEKKQISKPLIISLLISTLLVFIILLPVILAA
ncbi:MAG: hypothetical protein V3V28_08845 [Polaribacter sp.]|uniref:hypothetical protein n=1 Tax=Polaribacter sp. TaxID=1920175 RepID=UPI002F3594C9